jgi:tRNA U34 5-carboxymethylaminomethyl modifying enzyme MnmG/GidA
MFTSRAEYRLSLRADNADLRLTPTANVLKVVDEPKRLDLLSNKLAKIEQGWQILNEFILPPEQWTNKGIHCCPNGIKKSARDVSTLCLFDSIVDNEDIIQRGYGGYTRSGYEMGHICSNRHFHHRSFGN